MSSAILMTPFGTGAEHTDAALSGKKEDLVADQVAGDRTARVEQPATTVATSDKPAAPGRRTGGARRRRVAGGRRHNVPVRFSEDEYEALRTRAAAAGLTPSAYLAAAAEPRDRLGRTTMSGEERRVWASELMATRRLLAATGNNLNQLARAANSGAAVDRAGAAASIGACDRVVDRIDALLDRLQAGRP